MEMKGIVQTEMTQAPNARQCKILHIFNKNVEDEERIINSYLAQGYEIKAVASSHASAYRIYLEKKL